MNQAHMSVAYENQRNEEAYGTDKCRSFNLELICLINRLIRLIDTHGCSNDIHNRQSWDGINNTFVADRMQIGLICADPSMFFHSDFCVKEWLHKLNLIYLLLALLMLTAQSENDYRETEQVLCDWVVNSVWKCGGNEKIKWWTRLPPSQRENYLINSVSPGLLVSECYRDCLYISFFLSLSIPSQH